MQGLRWLLFRDTLGFGAIGSWELDGHGELGHEALGHSSSCFGGSGAGWSGRGLPISECSILGMGSFFTFSISAFSALILDSGSRAGALVSSACFRAFWRASSSFI